MSLVWLSFEDQQDLTSHWFKNGLLLRVPVPPVRLREQNGADSVLLYPTCSEPVLPSSPLTPSFSLLVPWRCCQLLQPPEPGEVGGGIPSSMRFIQFLVHLKRLKPVWNIWKTLTILDKDTFFLPSTLSWGFEGGHSAVTFVQKRTPLPFRATGEGPRCYFPTASRNLCRCISSAGPRRFCPETAPLSRCRCS